MSARKSFLLRIEPGLYQELEGWAQQELRSVNGQIEYLLKQAVAKRKGRAVKDTSSGEMGEQAGHRPAK
jgi:hypothetical protein